MQNEKDLVENDEISLKDIFVFFKENRKLIAITAVGGFLLAVAYVLLAPKKYEARLFLQMAQVQNVGSIETPPTLGERLRYPATYSEAVAKACGIDDTKSVGEYLGGMLKVSVPKAMPGTLEMNVRALTPSLATQCAESLVAMIEKQQQDLIEERLWGRNEQLAGYQQAMADELRQLETIKKSEAGNFGYLAKLDKLSWLRTRIDALQEEAMLAQKHPTKLAIDIDVADHPVSPDVKLALLVGLLIGVFLGVVLALARTVWRKANA